MNIHEIAKRSGVSLVNLRKLDRMGVLIVDQESERAGALRFHMARNPQLTTGQLLELMDDSDLIDELGSYEPRAREQLAAIDWKGTALPWSAPKYVTAAIRDAGKGDENAARIIAGWLMEILPAVGKPVGHHWVAVRLLHPLNAHLREQNSGLVSFALSHVRRLPEFAGYWKLEKIGKKNETRYFSLDL